MATMLLPLGPLTSTQAPHSAELSQLLLLNAVPKILLGNVYVEKEHAPPLTLPP